MVFMTVLTMVMKIVLFHGVDNSDDGADKHLAHLSQGVDCHLTQRSEQNKHVIGNKDDDDDDDSVDNGDDDVDEDSIDNDVDNSVKDSDDKHLTHLSQGVDCHLTQRSEQNKHVVGNEDNDDDDGVDIGDDNSVGDGDASADKHLTHVSQG
eukprot:12813323-Ditylum_brightwellii.AAC.1